MDNFTLKSKQYVPERQGWLVDCVLENKTGTRSGTEYCPLAETATDEEIQSYIINQYKGA